MAKSIISQVETGEENPASYESIQKYNPVKYERPKVGTLKAILEKSKESQAVSPYKTAPKPVNVKPEKPSPIPVKAAPILTTDVLEPIAPMEQRISPRPAPEVVPQAPLTSITAPLEEARKISVSGKGEIKKLLDDMAEMAYSGPRPPLTPKDVWKNEIQQGLKTGEFKTYLDENNQLGIQRKAPEFLEAVWEGQKSTAESLRDGVRYYFMDDDQKKNSLEATRIYSALDLPEEESKKAAAGRIVGQVGGQILMAAGAAAIPGVGAFIGAPLVASGQAASQGLQSELEAYNMARQSGLDEDAAYKVAEQGRNVYLGTAFGEGVISNVVLGGLGKAFSAATPAAAKGFKNAINTYGKIAKSKSLEVGLDASTAALASAIRDFKLEETTGGDVNVGERALENAALELVAGGAISTIAAGAGQFKRAIPKWLKSQSLNVLSTMDKGAIETELKNLQQKGDIDEKQANQILSEIDNFKITKENNPDVPEEKAGTIIGLYTLKQNLEKKLKESDESSAPALQSEIDAVNNQIKVARENPDILAGEIDDLTGLPLIKTPEYATTISEGQQQKGPTEGGISQYQRTQGVQEQAPDEADNRNRPISEPQEVIPESFNTTEGKRVFSQVKRIINETYTRSGRKKEISEKPEVVSKRATENYLQYLTNSKLFKDADDVQREQLLRDAKTLFSGQKFKPAPSVAKVLGNVKDKITVNEMSALKRLMKFGEVSSREAIQFATDTRKSISDGLKQLGKRGIVKTRQLQSILSKYDKVNLSNPEAIDRFVTYTSKIINDANYDAKLKEAQNIRNLIKRASSIKGREENLSSVAKNFASINPLDVDNIDEYINIAKNIVKGVKPSKSKTDLTVDFNQAFSTATVTNYTNNQKEAIEQSNKNKRMSEYQDLVDSGVLTGDMSVAEMNEVISGIEETANPPLEDKERYIRAYVKKRFESLSAFAKDLINKGQDAFGLVADRRITQQEKSRILKAIEFGVDDMTLADAYRMVESLDNFVVNGDTYGLEDILKRYEGNEAGNLLPKKLGKAKSLTFLGIKSIGRKMAVEVETLPMILYQMFRTDSKAALFMRLSGLYDLMNNKVKAEKISISILEDFIKTFEGKTANGKEYNDAENQIEQGILAFMRRNRGGSPKEINELFQTRKKLVQESITALETSQNEKDIEKAELYKTVFDRILSDSENANDVESKTDKTNVDVVNYWTKKWSENYDQLNDVSKAIYRQDLGKDNLYNPDIYKRVDYVQTDEDFANYDPFNNSGFAYNYDEYIPKKMSGTLMKTKPVSAMPEGKYLDFNFISNSNKTLKSALVDTYTAGDVRKVSSMLNSKGITKIINPKDLAVLKNRISLFVKRSRNMDSLEFDELSDVYKGLARTNRLITSLSLGSLMQPVKQTVPLAFKTLIGAGRFDVGDAVSMTLSTFLGKKTPLSNFLDRAGYGVSIRGLESTANIQALNSAIVDARKGKIASAINKFDEKNSKILKLVLSNPDAIIARASWISYYKSALKAKGVDINKIDWDTHEVDQESADTAQLNVDLQQNVSDADLQGKFIGSKQGNTAFIRNVLMPFSGFVMNSKAKIQNDANALFLDKTLSNSEKLKAGRGLIGQFVEVAVYSAITAAISRFISNIVSDMFDEEESEKESEKLAKSTEKSFLTNMVNDGFSPLPPFANNGIDLGINIIADYFQQEKPEEFKTKLYQGDGKTTFEKMIDNVGLFGIGTKKLTDAYKSGKYAITGEVTSNFAGKESVKKLGAAEREMAAAASVLHFLYLSRLVPFAEMSTVANKINRLIEKKALTEKKDILAQAVSAMPVEKAKLVKGENINQAISKSISYKDPQSRAKYLISIENKFGSDEFVKSLDLAAEAKILDNPTIANYIALKEGNKDKLSLSGLFSYKNQDERVYKLLQLKENMGPEVFYDNLKWAMNFKLLNKDGLLLLAESIGDISEEEIEMLIQSVGG